MKLEALKSLPIAVGLTFLILGFQNCSSTKFAPDSGALSLKASGTGDTTLDDANSFPERTSVDDMTPVGETEDDYNVAFSGACSVLQSIALPLSIGPSATDMIFGNGSGPLVINSAKNLSIANRSGDVFVKSASSLQIENVSGRTQVAANEVSYAINISGRLCIRAVEVGTINNISGGSKLIAKSISEITNQSGSVHIYGATVGIITGSSGQICLHDGAKVLTISNSSSYVGACP